MHIRFILFITSLLFCLSSFSQNWELIEKNEPFFYRFRLIDSLKTTPLNFPGVPYSSYVVRAISLEDIMKNLKGAQENLKLDPHQPENLGMQQSIQYFKLDEGPAVQLINSSGVSFELLLFYAPTLNSISNDATLAAAGCVEPASIPQSTWRSGLPEPTVIPGVTTTRHVIVHHSAGSNTASDPTALVRDIYLLHTQGNGWDDIGYNYLIARNGSIFLGRDPQSAGAQDFILGAHYCGKNSYTMGICLLGEYTQAQPTDTMMQSLRSLCVWKMFKDQIEPENQSLHPPSDPNARLVYHLDGHRSGCATECPGNQIYARLAALRDTLTDDLFKCGFTSIQSKYPSSEFVLYYSETSLMVNKKSEGNSAYQLMDLSGRIIQTGLLSEGLNLLELNTQNLIILSIDGELGTFRHLVQVW